MNRKEIEDKVQEILRDHGMLDMVVDPVKIANAIKAKVYNAKFGDEKVVGMIANKSGNVKIYVNADDPPQRKRFTIAHELGHLILHLHEIDGEFVDDKENFRSLIDPGEAWTSERIVEWEANAFAAALLMPENSIRNVWKNVQDVNGMAEWFQVSKQAMAIRLENVGITA